MLPSAGVILPGSECGFVALSKTLAIASEPTALVPNLGLGCRIPLGVARKRLPMDFKPSTRVP